MVRPIPNRLDSLPEGVTTRITLWHTQEDARVLLEELRALPETALLFLRRIQNLRIVIHQMDAPEHGVISREFSKSCVPSSAHDGEVVSEAWRTKKISMQLVTLTARSHEAGKPDTSELFHYRLMSRTCRDMPEDDKRPGKTKAEVQLAFPVSDATGKHPKISDDGEFVFAYLPMSKKRHLPVRQFSSLPNSC